MALLEHIGMNTEAILSFQPKIVEIFEINSASQSSQLKYINLLMVLKNLLRMLDIDDFLIMELFRPRQPRISQILCTILVFLQHKEENEELVSSKIKEIVGRGEKCEALEEELNQLDNILPERELEAESNKESNNEKIKRISELDSIISSIKINVDTQKAKYDQEKKQNIDLSDKKEQIHNENEDLQKEIDVLTRNIVHFPQKIIEDAEKCNEKLSFMNDLLNNLNQQLKETRNHLQNCKKSLQTVEACHVIPDTFSEDFDKIKKIKEEISNFQQINIDVSTTIQNCRNEIQFNQEQLEIKQMSINRLEADLEKKRDEAKKKLEQIQNTKYDRIAEIKELRSSFKLLVDKLAALKLESEKFNTDAHDDVARYNYLCEVSSAIYNFENMISN